MPSRKPRVASTSTRRCPSRRERNSIGVSPVITTLLLIAVAVSISLLLFMWSQGMLGNVSGSTGSQQAAQNQAAQSGILIEEVTVGGTTLTTTTITTTTTTSHSTTQVTSTITITTGSAHVTSEITITRVSVVTLTSTVTGTSTGTQPADSIVVYVRNVGAVATNLGSLTIQGSSGNAGFKGFITAAQLSTSSSSSGLTSSSGSWTVQESATTIDKGGSVAITLTGTGTSGTDTSALSGDTLNVKVTTKVGTLATGQFAVP